MKTFLPSTSSGQGKLLRIWSRTKKTVVRKIIYFRSFQRMLLPPGQWSDSSVSRCLMAALLIFTSDPEAARSNNSKITTTLGLVVHAAGREPFSFLLHRREISVYLTGTSHMSHFWAGLQGKGCLIKSSRASTSPGVLNGFYIFYWLKKRVIHGKWKLHKIQISGSIHKVLL